MTAFRVDAAVAADAAASLPIAPSSVAKAAAIARAAQLLLLHLERGQRIDAPMLRTAMESAFGASDADGGWGAFAPDVPGCYAVAKTRAEIETRMAEALRAHIELLREQGLPIPAPHHQAGSVAA